MEKMNSFTKIIKIKLIFASICAIFPILTIILFELPVTSDFIHQYFPIKDEPVILRYLINWIRIIYCMENASLY